MNKEEVKIKPKITPQERARILAEEIAYISR